MGNLVTFQEILTRYEAGENAFDLTPEKWVKIRESLKEALTMTHSREILGAATIKGPPLSGKPGQLRQMPHTGHMQHGKRGVIR